MMEILELPVTVKTFLPEEVEILESHKFEEIKMLFWRNSNLNFNNALSLIKSLEEKPNRDWLRKIHECGDEKLLKYFLKDMERHNIKNNEETLEIALGMLSDT